MYVLAPNRPRAVTSTTTGTLPSFREQNYLQKVALIPICHVRQNTFAGRLIFGWWRHVGTRMGVSAETKHVMHVTTFALWLILFEILCGAIPVLTSSNSPSHTQLSPFESYGYVGALLLYALRIASLLVLPQCICNMLGLVLFNGFREKVKLKAAPLLAPLVCYRVVTRGDYPELVKQNIKYNMAKCRDAGMENFIFEVVTDKAINVPSLPRLREVVVPSTYRTKSGALFKSRALQYCLEDDVNILQDDDWVVHLDEETLLTENAICGILNFCEDGRHQFGQGVITYANGEIVNWITTLSDSFRVADDMGKLRFQFRFFHKPLFGWKGSFVVTQVGAERKVSFDHGREGSIAEDCFFSMIAFRDGYTFDFIEGEMHEKSPFTFWDFLQQRKRWIQGIYLTVHAKQIPTKNKILLGLSFYAWATMPLTSLQVFLFHLFPLPPCFIFDFLVGFVAAVNLYMYIYGVIKSFSNKYRHSPLRLCLYMAGAMLTIPFNVWIENIAVLWGMLGDKNGFYVVKKDVQLLNEHDGLPC
uniref:Beta-1,4-mannosyltransferase bre-3 n=2 Tax=Ascaris TaxID=6251 RepID=A0A0M3HMN5_ASCLU